MPIVTLQQLLHIGPHNRAHWAALRSSIGIFVPLLTLVLTDHMHWALYATFGSFCCIYGRAVDHGVRFRMQAQVGIALTFLVALGVAVGASEHRSWLGIIVAAAVASLGSLYSDLRGWSPPGPLFLVFAFAACASVPSHISQVPTALGVAAATATFGVLVGQLGRIGRRVHNLANSDLPTRPLPRTLNRLSASRRHVLRYVASVLIAGSIATLSGIGHPYWAMIGAVVPLASRELPAQIIRGLHRIGGTLAGIAVTAVLLQLHLAGLWLILVVALLQGAAELFVVRNYALGLMFITPLALLMVHLAAPVPVPILLFDRSVETIIGVTVGIGVAWVTRNRVEYPGRARRTTP